MPLEVFLSDVFVILIGALNWFYLGYVVLSFELGVGTFLLWCFFVHNDMNKRRGKH